MEHALLPVIQTFNTWTNLAAHIGSSGIGKVNAVRGIFHNALNNTILRSVDGTSFYKDEGNMYTLSGRVGDQSIDLRDNSLFLRRKKAFLYRKTRSGAHMWYGEVEIIPDSLESIDHIDMDGNMRKIYRVALRSVTKPMSTNPTNPIESDSTEYESDSTEYESDPEPDLADPVPDLTKSYPADPMPTMPTMQSKPHKPSKPTKPTLTIVLVRLETVSSSP